MLLRAVRAAAVAVLVSWGLLVVLAVLGWLTATGESAQAPSAVGVASALWSLAHLGGVSDGATTISLVPLGLLALPLLVVTRAARALRPDLEADTSPRLDVLGGLRRESARALGAFVGTYAGLGLLAALVARLGPLVPAWWQTTAGAAAVALAGVLLGLRGRLGPLLPSWRDQLLVLAPLPVRRGAAVGARSAALLLAAGLVPVVASLALRWPHVVRVHEGLATGVVGGLLLVLAQALLLPDLVAWGLSWIAGPGFVVGAGSSFTWTEARSVLLPTVPVMAALPDAGRLSPWWCLVGLVPVAVGAWAGSRALGTVSRLSSTATKVRAVAVAVVTAAVLCLVALVLSGGALGTRSLVDVGPRAVPAAAALLAELTLGAGLTLGWSVWRFNRR